MLSGDGGDETFAGYNSYQEWMGVLENCKKDNQVYSTALSPKWDALISYFSLEDRRRLWRTEFHDMVGANCGVHQAALENSDKSDPLRMVQTMDYQIYLPGDILHKMDIASMYHGLEVRTPFTDVAVAELATRLPMKQRLRKENGEWISKYVLKSTLNKSFPSSFVHRPKQGFSIPRKEWLAPQTRGQNLGKRVISQCQLFQHLFNAEEMNSWFNKTQNDRGHLWLLIVLGLWIEQNPEIQFY